MLIAKRGVQFSGGENGGEDQKFQSYDLKEIFAKSNEHTGCFFPLVRSQKVHSTKKLI